ncbi:hypothetical protein [Okeania sp. SIO2B3]|nr:hypothetical protein [Okeania sp. SIO2B3]NET45204.1 hypothetical protein [Okeania sp. SIO2B3]
MKYICGASAAAIYFHATKPNWFIAVDADSEEYSIDLSLEGLVQKI